MCTRYTVTLLPEVEKMLGDLCLSNYTALLEERTGKTLSVDHDVFPGSLAPVIARSRTGKQRSFPMVFGYSGSGKKQKLVNARVETASSKPSFRDSWISRRCCAVATSYYEWQKPDPETGEKPLLYSFYSGEEEVLYLCGLYRIINGIPEFVILTQDAPHELSLIHDRMPLIMPEGLVEKWIDPASDPNDLLQYAVKDLTVELM